MNVRYILKYISLFSVYNTHDLLRIIMTITIIWSIAIIIYGFDIHIMSLEYSCVIKRHEFKNEKVIKLS